MSRFIWNIPLGKASWTLYNPFTQSWQGLLYTAQTKLWLEGRILKEGFVTWAGETWQASQHLLGQTPVCMQAALACWQVSQLHLPFLYPNWLCQKYSEAHNTVHILGSGPLRSTCTKIHFSLWNLSQTNGSWIISLKLTESYNGLLIALMLFHSHIKLMLLSMWLLYPLIYHPVFKENRYPGNTETRFSPVRHFLRTYQQI